MEFTSILERLNALDGEELVRYWLKMLDSFPSIDVRKEFQKRYSENFPEAIKEKLTHAMRQWIDLSLLGMSQIRYDYRP